MATTIKQVRRNGGSCICKAPDMRLHDDEFSEDMCRYKVCVVLRCTACRGKLAGWGPVGCKCESGPRWLRYPAMAELGQWDLVRDAWKPASAAVKPSLVRRGNRHFR